MRTAHLFLCIATCECYTNTYMPPVYTYRFATHWVTTSDELTGYIERFEVTPSEVEAIEAGELPNEVLQVEDPAEHVPEEISE